MQERLQKIMAARGIGSRRKCEEIITAGKVTVDGTKAILGQKADPDVNHIQINGKDINEEAPRRLYLLLNKPSGYTCTKAEHPSETTVMKLLKPTEQSVFPVGRLDKNTTGLLILTNDGDFSHKITHPSKEIEKTYLAYCLGRVSEDDLRTIEKGVELYDGRTAACKAVFKSYNSYKDLTTVEITIHEGKKRQVRRMFASVGHDVKHLARIKLGMLTLKGVKEGTYRKLTREEIDFFKTDV